jgi:hypothetical protein
MSGQRAPIKPLSSDRAPIETQAAMTAGNQGMSIAAIVSGASKTYSVYAAGSQALRKQGRCRRLCHFPTTLRRAAPARSEANLTTTYVAEAAALPNPRLWRWQAMAGETARAGEVEASRGWSAATPARLRQVRYGAEWRLRRSSMHSMWDGPPLSASWPRPQTLSRHDRDPTR